MIIGEKNIKDSTGGNCIDSYLLIVPSKSSFCSCIPPWESYLRKLLGQQTWYCYKTNPFSSKMNCSFEKTFKVIPLMKWSTQFNKANHMHILKNIINGFTKNNLT